MDLDCAKKNFLFNNAKPIYENLQLFMYRE